MLRRRSSTPRGRRSSELARESADGGPALLVTLPWRDGRRLLQRRRCCSTAARSRLRFKHELPNYGVFDEKRVFAPGPLPSRSTFRGVAPRRADLRGHLVRRRRRAPGASRAPSCCWCPTARRSRSTSSTQRLDLARARVAETGLPLAYVNQVGGQDELVFDGGSFVVNADGTLAQRAAVLARSARRSRAGERGADGCWRCATAPSGADAAAAGADLPAPWCWACATTCDKNGFPGVRARPVRRHRFGAHRRRGGRRARRRPRARRACCRRAYTSAGQPGRRGGIRARCSASRSTRSPIEPAVEAFGDDAGAALRRPRRATSPRRTSRRASAACR